MKEIFKVIVSLICSCISTLVGGFDSLSTFLIYMMLIDIFLGFGSASILGTVNSRTFFEGGYKKVMTLFVIYVSTLIDKTFLNGFVLRDSVIMYFIAGEGISFIESVGEVIELPNSISKFFIDLKEKGEDNFD